ncbi:hypothetical protein E2C01_032664 [Portunus trituberculatus]|uniref:Uncharacterized protein n=1 Tax=Portunus trituberculatus TaxID=210409 RepID=A0A5B7EY24_PORTR|nr:hypothetical protein [Portunus trituberculatus]
MILLCLTLKARYSATRARLNYATFRKSFAGNHIPAPLTSKTLEQRASNPLAYNAFLHGFGVALITYFSLPNVQHRLRRHRSGTAFGIMPQLSRRIRGCAVMIPVKVVMHQTHVAAQLTISPPPLPSLACVVFRTCVCSEPPVFHFIYQEKTRPANSALPPCMDRLGGSLTVQYLLNLTLFLDVPFRDFKSFTEKNLATNMPTNF